jgi:hypothetical protein
MTANSVRPAMRRHETASRIEVCRSTRGAVTAARCSGMGERQQVHRNEQDDTRRQREICGLRHNIDNGIFAHNFALPAATSQSQYALAGDLTMTQIDLFVLEARFASNMRTIRNWRRATDAYSPHISAIARAELPSECELPHAQPARRSATQRLSSRGELEHSDDHLCESPRARAPATPAVDLAPAARSDRCMAPAPGRPAPRAASTQPPAA